MRHLLSAAVLAALNLACWALLLAPIDSLWPGRAGGLAILGVALSLLTIAAIVAAATSPQRQPASGRQDAVAVIGAAGALLIAGFLFSDVEPVRALLLFILASAALLLGLAAAEQLKAGRSIEITSHWGGLGGSIGGWRISSTTTTILLALIFLAAAVALVPAEDGGEGNAIANDANQAATDGNGVAEAEPAANVAAPAADNGVAANADAGNEATEDGANVAAGEGNSADAAPPAKN